MRKSPILALAGTLFVFALAFAGDQKNAETSLQLTQCALKVSGMTCGGCAAAVQQALLKVDGVKQAEVDFKSGDVRVQFDPKKTTPGKIVAAFNENNPGFKAKLAEKKEKADGSGGQGQAERKSCCP